MPRPALAALLATLVVAFGCPSATPVPGDGSGNAAADAPRVAWLRSEAVPLRSIDPADDDFSDLEPLRSALAGVQVVVLGEATHGGGSTFRAKTRLIRFLHREMGFDVLAFESGFYDCRKAWQAIEEGEDPETALRRSVFPIWTRSVQVQPLIDHFSDAARSDRPLRLAGFDPQFTGEYSERFLLDELVRVAQAVGLSGERFRERIGSTLTNVIEARHETGEMPEPAERSAFLAALAEIEEGLRRGDGEVPDRGFWLRLVESTADNAVAGWDTDWTRSVLESPEEYGVRERLMGEQLAWLARERFPGRKIVAWMHAGHAFRAVDGIEVPSETHTRLYRTLRPAGGVARDALGEALYTVAVLAYQGSYSPPFFREPIELWRPSEGSLEDLFHRTGLDHAFLDLTRDDLPRWLRGRTIARPVGYKEMRARWRTVYDGLLFLDRMEPSTEIESPPQPTR